MESSNLIARQLQKEAIILQRKKRKQRLIKFFIICGLLILIILGLAFYFSPLSKIVSINVHEGNIYSKKDLENSLILKTNDSLLFIDKNKIFSKDLAFIDSVNIKVDFFKRSIDINVNEKEIIGYFLTSKINVFSLDGSITIIDDNKTSLIANKVRVSNFDKNTLLKLIDSIKNSDPILYSNISEIILEPKSYDESYLKLIMQDGVIVYTSIHSFESLKINLYKDMLNLLSDDYRCIKYDVFMKNAYAFKCPTK